MLLKEVYKLFSLACPEGLGECEVKSITSNINEIYADTVFVWVKGIGYNTDKLTDKIIKARPLAIVMDEDRIIYTDIPTLRVSSARGALSLLCSMLWGIDYSRTRFIGVTGTNGKTSCATMIYEILKHAGVRVGFIGTGKILYMDKGFTDLFYSMTTPVPELLYKSIRQMQDEGCEAVVMEVSSHALSLERVGAIPFSYSLFTNLSDEHLDFHEDKESYFLSKLKLFEQSEYGIFNADDEYASRAMRESFDKCNATSVGIVWDAEARAINISSEGFLGSTFFYKDSERIFKVKLPLVGSYNVYNALMALKCTIDYGIKAYVAKQALERLSPIEGRFEAITAEITVIIDYAHTPFAFENILKTVNSLKKPRQKIIVVFGAGGDRDKSKRPEMAKICEKYTDLSIVTNDNERGECGEKIIADICRGFTIEGSYKIITPRREAIREAILSAADGDVVLLLGKGHERYNIVNGSYTPFDEREIARAALEERRKESK